MTGLKNANFQFRTAQGQLIGRKNPTGARADNQYVVMHAMYLLFKSNPQRENFAGIRP